MPELTVYSIARKGDETNVLVPDRDPTEYTKRMSYGDIVAQDTHSQAKAAYDRQEPLKVNLLLGSEAELESLVKPPEKNSLTDRLSVFPEVSLRVQKTFYDTIRQNDTMRVGEGYIYLHRILEMYNSIKGVRGIMHRGFPILFFLNGIPAFQPMAWTMMLVQPKGYNNIQQEIGDHYRDVLEGLQFMYASIAIEPKVDVFRVGIINHLIKEDKNGEGYNTARRHSQVAGLPMVVFDQISIMMAAAEGSDWERYMRAPAPFGNLPLGNDIPMEKLGR